MRRHLVMLLLLVSTAAAADPKLAARERVDRGNVFYDLGRFPEAAKELEAAYLLVPDPALLFNIGQAYRRAGDAVSAIRAFQAFRRNSPLHRGQVTLLIYSLQATLDKEECVKQPGVCARPSPSPSEDDKAMLDFVVNLVKLYKSPSPPPSSSCFFSDDEPLDPDGLLPPQGLGYPPVPPPRVRCGHPR